MDLRDLIKKIKRYNKNSDVDIIEKAYKFSESIIKDKKRASGEPWIKHYIAVASEVANLKLDDISIACALMHGVLNKGADIKDIKKIFNNDVILILENIETMTQIKKNISRVSETENMKKVLLAAARDIRALLVKICDKVVNLRDLEFLDPSERNRIARESMDIYAPLAYRLGMGKIKSEIEDLAFKYLDEGHYKEIETKVNMIRKEGEILIFKIKKIMEKELEKENIKAKVQSRVKHLYSIYKKIVDRSYKIDEMVDIVGLRVIVNNLDDCYKALKVVHSLFRPLPNKLKDYIAMPKPNGYQSLHTTVVDKEGKIFEVQIRTQEMHDISEEGIAAHFSYKKISEGKEFDTRLNWLKQLVENKESLENFDTNFFGDEIFTFTPKGKVIELPSGSTVIDFAYQVHSTLGDHCTGAYENGKFVSLKDKLENGDVVEILTSKTQKPSREWLKFARTTKARTKIKQALKVAGKLAARTYSIKEENKKDIGESLLKFYSDKKFNVKLALCCKPVPGDNIISIKTSNVKLMIHRGDCKEIIKTKNKKMKVGWVDKFTKPIKIIVDARERTGLIKEILNNVKNFNINVMRAKGKVLDKNVEFSFMAEVDTLDKLNTLINRISKIKDVKKVYLEIL